AKALNISQAEVHGVISFYHDFRRSAPGRNVLKVCNAEACQSMGSRALIQHLENRLQTTLGSTSRDGSFTIEPVYCLGLCAMSPTFMLNGQPFGRVSAQTADVILDSALRHL